MPRNASTYMDKVKKYAPDATEEQVQKIVNYLGVSVMNNDARLISCSDKTERDRVRDGFAAKKLGLSSDEAETMIEKLCQDMKGDGSQKNRVAFLYMMAKHAGKLDSL